MSKNDMSHKSRLEVRCNSPETVEGFKRISNEFQKKEHIILWLIENFEAFKQLRAIYPDQCFAGISSADDRNEYYCPKFNGDLKSRVRAFWNYTCAECGVPEGHIRHGVHHVTYNKGACCTPEDEKLDESLIKEFNIPEKYKFMFVPLCRRCHGKTNTNRDRWKRHFVEIIKVRHGGKSYYFKGEEREMLKSIEQEKIRRGVK